MPLEAVISSVDPISSKPRSREHLAFLDSLRALAALWVVLSHIWIFQFGMFTHSGLLGDMTNWAVYSHLAVDVFIVLSGFCLILPVQRARELQGSPLSFFERRARRILPPFYAALFFSLIVALVLQLWNHLSLGLPLHAILINAGLMQDIFLDQDVFNGPFWSIAVEWRIYFLFPILACTLMRWGAAASITWTAVLGYALTYAIFRWQPSAIMACPWYLILFALGACAGAAANEARISLSGTSKAWSWYFILSGITVGVLLHSFPITSQSGTDFGRHMPLIDTVMGACTACFMILVTRADTSVTAKLASILSTRPLVTLGSFAYSLYLVHMPCLLLLNRLLGIWPLTPIVRVILMTALGLPFIIAFAYLFFVACERPFLRSWPKWNFATRSLSNAMDRDSSGLPA